MRVVVLLLSPQSEFIANFASFGPVVYFPSAKFQQPSTIIGLVLVLFWASLAHFIAFGLLCPIRAPLSHFILLDILGSFYHFRAPLSHFILLGILDLFHRFRASLSHSGSFVPFVFPWVSRACLLSMGFLGAFPNFTSPWAFTEFFGLPSPIMLFLILGVHGLAINPLLSLFSLLWACRGPILIFPHHILPMVCFFSLFGLL